MKEELHKKHPTQLNMCVSSDWPTIVIKKNWICTEAHMGHADG